jgi:hypothetical protein
MPDWKSMLGIGFLDLEVAWITFLLTVGMLRTDEGKVVKISANGTVALCAAEDTFYGQLRKVDTDGDIGSIQSDSYMEVSYTGAPALGYQNLVADGLGGVKPPSPGVKATLALGVIANNNAILLTAKKYGTNEQDISITVIDPPGNNAVLAVDVVGRDINITLATDGASAPTSTAAQVIAAIAASPAADLVAAANNGASTGAGVVVAAAVANLAGGVDASKGRPVDVISIDAVAGKLIMEKCC